MSLFEPYAGILQAINSCFAAFPTLGTSVSPSSLAKCTQVMRQVTDALATSLLLHRFAATCAWVRVSQSSGVVPHGE